MTAGKAIWVFICSTAMFFGIIEFFVGTGGLAALGVFLGIAGFVFIGGDLGRQ